MRMVKGKARERFFEAYVSSNSISICDVYSRPSQNKLVAENRCLTKKELEGGWNYRILSYNTFAFTCGWLVVDPATGELMLRVETACNSYIMEY